MKTDCRDAFGGQERRPAGARTAASSPAAALSASVTELLGLASVGDRLAWDDIMRRYHHLVLSKVHSFRLQDADAHDAMQMTWLRLIENHHRILFPEQLGRWLATTASRECLSILRDAKHSPNQNNTTMDHVADPAASPEQHVIHRDGSRTLRNLVAELAPRERILLEALFSDEPPPYAELARITRIPHGSIGPTRARALRHLRQKLEAARSRCHCCPTAHHHGRHSRV